MKTFDQFVSDAVGKADDRDGAFGAQCWDLFAAYCLDVLGCPDVSLCSTAGYGEMAGLAGSLYANYPVSSWQNEVFSRLPSGVPVKRGDVLVWGFDSEHPLTHVAIAVEDAVVGAMPLVLAQNVDYTQAARIMYDTSPSLGILRPKLFDDSSDGWEVIDDMKATHIVFQYKNSLGICNVLAGTYTIYANSDDYRDNVYVLKQAGAKVVEWGALRGKPGENSVGNLEAFGVRV